MSSKILYVVNKTKTGFFPSVKIDLLTGTYCTERILNKSQLIEFRHALSLHKYPYVSNSWIQTTMLFRKQNKCFAVLDRLALWLCLIQFALLSCERWQMRVWLIIQSVYRQGLILFGIYSSIHSIDSGQICRRCIGSLLFIQI